jgi:aryl-alcohol dehydrogenase-like predicted oxidoreductase
LITDIHDSGATVIARGVLGSGLLDDRLSIDELRARTDRWQSIDALRALAGSLGVTTVQLAFWFVRARPDVSTFLVGMSSTDHVDSAADASRSALPSAEVLEAIASIVGTDSSNDP